MVRKKKSSNCASSTVCLHDQHENSNKIKLEKKKRKVGSVSGVPRTMGDNLLAGGGRGGGLCNR